VDIEITNQGSEFNNDNIFDLCISTPSVGGETSEMMVYLGNGDGSFDQQIVRTVRGQIFGNCVGDFNNDGELDIAYVNGAERYLAILFGDGDGTFTNELRYDVPHFTPQHIDAFDADLDGDVDVMIAANAPDLVPGILHYFSSQLNPANYSAHNFSIMACDNATIELTSPGGKIFNHIKSTMPSGVFYKRNLDNNEYLDNYASLGVVEGGRYNLTARPRPDLPPGETFTIEYNLDGEFYRLAKDIPMREEGYQLSLYLAKASEVLPRPGEFILSNPPGFAWTGAGTFDFQLAHDIDFTDVLFETSVAGNQFTPPAALPVTDTSLFYWRIKPSGTPEYSVLYAVNIVNAVSSNCGDATNDGMVNVGDAVQLINYIFRDGPAPVPVCQGDASGDGEIDVGDAVYLIRYLFKGGPAPVEPCCP